MWIVHTGTDVLETKSCTKLIRTYVRLLLDGTEPLNYYMELGNILKE